MNLREDVSVRVPNVHSLVKKTVEPSVHVKPGAVVTGKLVGVGS